MYWTPYCKGMGKVQPAAWGICNPKVNKKTRWKLLESCVMLRLVYRLHQACFPKKEMKKIEFCWFQLSRSMVKGGWMRVSEDPKDIDFRFVYRNNDLQRIIVLNLSRTSSWVTTFDTLAMYVEMRTPPSQRKWCSPIPKPVTIQIHGRRLLKA